VKTCIHGAGFFRIKIPLIKIVGMKKALTLTVLTLLLSTTIMVAQKNRVPSKSIATELKIGDRFYAEGYFYTAVEYYKDAVRQKPENRYANFWLAASFLRARDYENAEVFFRKFYAIKPGEKDNKSKWQQEDERLFNKGGLFFGEVLHRNGKYDEAIDYLNKFVSRYKPVDEKDNSKDLAKLEIAGCEFAKTAGKAKVKIKNAGNGINKSYTDASPFGLGDSVLYYTSVRSELNNANDTIYYFDGAKPKLTYAIYKSAFAGNEWSKGKLLANEDINEKGYSVGNGTFNKDLTRFYFTKCLELDDDRSLCNLFVADHKGGNFSNVQRLPEPINEKEKSTSTQSSVRTSADGMEIVYFSSDRVGGVGGMDIWYFLRAQNGEFKGPKLVPTVNTLGDERTPYFDDSTKTLYFSSNGQPGFGGFDVFKTEEQQDLTWGPVTNLGQPLNTGADELYYTRSSDQTYGFLVSNREGSVPQNGIKTASDDIFTWTNFKYAVQGMVFKDGEDAGGVLTGATFKLYRKLEDGTKVLVGVDSSAKTGVRLDAPGNVLPGKKKDDGMYFFKLNPETDYIVEVERDGFQPKFESITTKGLPDEDTIQNNMNIRKAAYVVKGLISQIVNNEPIIGASVTLIEIYPNGMEKTNYYMNSNPYFTFDVDMNKNYKLVVKKEGYFANTTILNTSNIGLIDTIEKNISIDKLELNKEYTLQNVLYEFGKATLTENSKTVLDNLYQILAENSTFVIELSAHTDAIGTDASNLKLSQARAESCVNYLISKGIAKDRLVPKGYGESKPKVPNTTEEGKDDPARRAINRRTEFKVLKG
jgi:outer membrane protein OmpA-like peptidoglycan-associated protein/tetratricopeptide (TPR) repeat protein